MATVQLISLHPSHVLCGLVGTRWRNERKITQWTGYEARGEGWPNGLGTRLGGGVAQWTGYEARGRDGPMDWVQG